VKDHVARFVEENFEIDPSGYCSHSALLRCYQDWCAAYNIVNRRLPLLVMLMEIEERYNARAKMTFLSVDRTRTAPGDRQQADGSSRTQVYVIVGLRFKHAALNMRQSLGARGSPSRVWKRVASGSVLDRIEAPELPDPFAEELDE